MKYYLVALFDDESYKNLSPIQKNLSKRYKANRNSPIPYIPLEVLENPNIDKLNLVIDKVLKPYKFFKVELSSKVSVSDTSKTLNLQIHDIGYIKRLSRLLSDNLKLHGFNTKNLSANENIHLTLANMNYFNKEVKRIDGPTELKSNLSTLKVNRLELWKISNNRRETLIQTYPLILMKYILFIDIINLFWFIFHGIFLFFQNFQNFIFCIRLLTFSIPKCFCKI